jgi:hypothetical protein
MKLHRLARALVLNWFVDASVTAMSIAAAHKFLSEHSCCGNEAHEKQASCFYVLSFFSHEDDASR